MIIKNGTIHPMDAPTISHGFVQFAGGKIVAVGGMDSLPSSDEVVLDAQGGHVLPGYIDAHCHLGMFGDGLGFEADDGNESTDPCTPQLRAIDALNPLDRCFEEARQGGVTTVFTGPGSANPIGGQFVAMKTSGRIVDNMLLKAPLAMKFALGENPKSVYNDRKESPVTRMATAAIIRENLAKGLEYQDQITKAEGDPDVDAPDFDPKLDVLRHVTAGTLDTHIHAHRADDIATAIRISKEFGLKTTLIHGTEGHLIADFLAQEGASVITGPFLGDRSKPELVNLTVENPAILHKAGVKIAICTDHPCTPIQQLPLCATMAVRSGLPEEEALKAITINAAQIGGVDDRVGSLTVGKDADIIVTTGHPLDWKSQITAVFIGGEQVN